MLELSGNNPGDMALGQRADRGLFTDTQNQRIGGDSGIGLVATETRGLVVMRAGSNSRAGAQACRQNQRAQDIPSGRLDQHRCDSQAPVDETVV